MEMCYYLCKTCDEYGEDKCTSCYNGFTPSGGTLGSCPVCPPDKPFLNLSYDCTYQCLVGYMPNRDNVCKTYRSIFLIIN